MSQIPQRHLKYFIFILIILPNIVNAWDWGDFHKFAVVFFTILGFGLGFLAILAVFYFGFMRNCLKEHQQDVLHTHRAFHPWPPGSAQWDRQRTYRASTGRSGGQKDIQYQCGVEGHQNTNIPYNTLSNQPYDVKETYQQKYPYQQDGEYGQQRFVTTDYHPQKTYINTPYNRGEKCYPEQYDSCNAKGQTHFTAPETYSYPTSYQKPSSYQINNNNTQQPSTYYHPSQQTQYPDNDRNLPQQQIRSLSPYYTSIEKKETSILKRSFSPQNTTTTSYIPPVMGDKSENVIVRNSTLINQQQSSSIMNTHTYI